MMTITEAETIYKIITDSKLNSLSDKLIKSAIRYARIRVDWHLMSTAERIVLDEERTIAHDAFINACNILSRNMALKGEDNSWRSKIGDDRKSIGDFACLLHAVMGIKAR
jgi:hypothetical protein